MVSPENCIDFVIYPVGNYMLKVNNRNTWIRCEICSKLTINTPERCQCRRSGVFIVNFEHISDLPCPSVSIVNFEHVNVDWVYENLKRYFISNHYV